MMSKLIEKKMDKYGDCGQQVFRLTVRGPMWTIKCVGCVPGCLGQETGRRLNPQISLAERRIQALHVALRCLDDAIEGHKETT